MSFFEELKRRNVFRVAIGYVITAWLLLQVVDLVLENINAPDWVMQVFMLALAIGFPLAVFFAWAFELTPEGIKKERDVDRSESVANTTGRKLDRSIIIILLIAVIYFAWDNFTPPTTSTEPAQPSGQSSVQEASAPKSIAVLPFADLSQAQDQEWFADGLAEEILNALAKTPDLLVSSRTSSFRYKGSTLGISDIAKDLGVAHILEGSVRSSANRIRVTAQLIRASDGFHLWSQNYDRDIADMIEIQEDLAQNIARALETTMDPEALAEMTRAGTRSVEAYREYIRGIAAYLESYAGTSTDPGNTLFKGYEHFENARRMDPDFAKAHLSAAIFWKLQLTPHSMSSGLMEVAPLQMLTEFNNRIDEAISTAATNLDKKSYMAQKATVELRLRDAVRLFGEYLDERPNDEDAWQALNDVAGIASDTRQRKKALAHWRERSDSDTYAAVSFSSDAYRSGLAAEGAEVGLKAAQRWPGNKNILYQAHRALVWAGRIEEAGTLADQLQRLYPAESVLPKARQHCAEGQRAEVESQLENNIQNDNDDISGRWHLLKLLGLEQESAEVLRPYAESGVPFMLASWLTYAKFDPTPFPALMAILEREGVKRPPPVEIPFQCPPPEQTSIAVLPFVNMSTDADNEFFSDGISEEILNVLASIPDLKVAARTSAFAYKGTNTRISDIARELGVNHILEGSVRKAGNQVRITAQLIKANDGFHLWSENYDRELTNIFVIQDEIAASIAEALKVSLELEKGDTGNLTGTNSIDAYEHYLKGMSLWHLRTAESLLQAIEAFEKAINLDPGFAKAHAGLGLAWVVIDGYMPMDTTVTLEKAEAAANKALSLDPENVEALAALAAIKAGDDMLDEAEALFSKAIRLNPSFATAQQWYGNVLGWMGDPEAGLVALRKAQNLDPRSRIISVNVAMTYRLMGMDQKAIDVLKEVREFAPDFPDGISQLMHAEMIVGNCEEVAKYGNELSGILNKVSNSTPIYVDLCQDSDLTARAKAMDTMLDWPTLDISDPKNPSLSYQIQLIDVMVELGEFEAALVLLEKNMDFDGPFLFRQIRARKTERGITFYCDQRVQSLYEKYNIPALENEAICD